MSITTKFWVKSTVGNGNIDILSDALYTMIIVCIRDLLWIYFKPALIDNKNNNIAVTRFMNLY
jgi:hypothetical protein